MIAAAETAARAPLRVLHVFSSFEFGGQQVRFVAFANAVGGSYEHHVVAMDDKTDAERLIEKDVPLHIHHLPVRKSAALSFSNLAMAKRLGEEVRPDVLCTYNWGAIEWAIVNRVTPIAGHVHFEDGFGPDESGGAFKQKRIWTRRAAFGPRTKVVVPSRVLEGIARNTWRLPAERIAYLANGVDLARFSPEGPVDRSYSGDEDEVVVGTVGALRREKNAMRLIRVFHRASDGRKARLVIVGDGPERPALEAEARDRGIADRVVFTGRIAKPEALMRGFDVFALSSDTEQMPLGLVEAMGCGRACASTDVGDVMDMVSPENRDFVIPKEAEADFAAAIGTLIDDADLRARLGAANRAKAEKQYSIDAMVARLDGLIREAASA
ncbi:MAG: glycosyltransferase family 4 protein [Pseudomonadota bacterium]